MKPLHRLLFLALGVLLAFPACEPYQVEDIALPAPGQAAFSFAFVPGDSNRVVFTDNSAGSFVRLWDFGNGRTSPEVQDTAFYPSAGTYEVSLAISSKGGSSVAKETLTILTDALVACDSVVTNLVGGCTAGDSAVWVFAQEPATVAIGPTQLSTEWFASPADGLVADQYDDSWVFAFAGSRHQYYNNGLTIDPAQGFSPVPFTPSTDVTWTLSPGTGFEGSTQILLTGESFIGVKNSGPVYDIIELTETRMVLLSQQTDGPGWFTQIFVRQ